VRDILEYSIEHHCRIIGSQVGVRPQPRITLVGLLELGSEALGLDDGHAVTFRHWGATTFAGMSTEERIYANAAYRMWDEYSAEDFDFNGALESAKACWRFLSLDEYKAEVGERQFLLETVPPAVQTKGWDE
jgi:hypothetical protein